MNNKPWWHPFYEIEITTPEQARLYNRMLVAKAIISMGFIIALIYLGGGSWWQLVVAMIFATVWKAVDIWRKR